MNKVKLFLYADGIVIFAAAIFFVYLYLRRGRVDHFRDNLWQDQQSLTPEQRAAEDARDLQILRQDSEGYDFDPYGRKAPDSAPRALGAPSAASRTKAAPRPASSSGRKPDFATPNFRGKPHEILGISPTADSELVTRAHKFWIKRYHPDRVSHLGPVYVEQARRRAEQLNSARHFLLQALAQRKT